MIFDLLRVADAADKTNQAAYIMQKTKQSRLTLLFKLMLLAVISSLDGLAGIFSISLMCVSLKIHVTDAKKII